VLLACYNGKEGGQEGMKVLKGQELIVHDGRKGTYRGVATKDFDTENDEWYEVATLEYVCGLSTYWDVGEKIPCRRGLATLEIARKEADNA
jgi:hypothetical protein